MQVISGVQSENTLPSVLISALFSVGECRVEGDVEGDEWSCRRLSAVLCSGTGASRGWTMSSGVSSRAGPRAR